MKTNAAPIMGKNKEAIKPRGHNPHESKDTN
jgi:hypothetical protein